MIADDERALREFQRPVALRGIAIVQFKNGFARVLRLSDPEDGEVDRYERPAKL